MKTRTIQGKEHCLILLKVNSRDEHGRPKMVEVGFDDTTFNIQGGEEFLTAWVLKSVISKKS